ncbi:MAG: endonuclease domain-containing protein [Ruminiclostridium sp.]|nr:endonuclease domain-containing protein [Ruminiclostridium sp.]
MGSSLSPNARTLRKKMTKEERHLWYDFLKSLPVTVHRQKIIGPYIVDFYIASAKTVIELDGSQHYEGSGPEKDAQRDAYLRSQGLQILRYSNLDVKTNFPGVCQDICRRTGIPLISHLR